MQFTQPLVEGRLIKRYKRFLADVELSDGSIITAHTANTGAMTGCCEPGSRVWLSRSDNPKRKYPFTWELIEVAPAVLCGINTQLSNHLVREAIELSRIGELSGYQTIRAEVPYGEESSRIDLLLDDHPNLPRCFVEVKNVTLVAKGHGLFPDAKTSRGTRHLRELMSVAAQGERAVIFFCVQRTDCDLVSPADEVDKLYGETLRLAAANGVEVMAYRAKVGVTGVELVKALPVIL